MLLFGPRIELLGSVLADNFFILESAISGISPAILDGYYMVFRVMSTSKSELIFAI